MMPFVAALFGRNSSAPPVLDDIDIREAAIIAAYGTVYEGAGTDPFDTTTTVSSLAELKAAITTAKSNFSKRWSIACNWDGRLTGSGTGIGIQSTALLGWDDLGGVLYITNAPGRTPAIGEAVYIYGGRGVHFDGVWLANVYNGTGAQNTQYCLQIAKNSTYPAASIVRIDNAKIGTVPWGGTEADMVTAIRCGPMDGELVLNNVRIDGAQIGLKVAMRRVRLINVDVKNTAGDAGSYNGHTLGVAYRSILWATQFTWRKPIDGLINRSAHMDLAQTGAGQDNHLGYFCLFQDCIGHAGHSFTGIPGGGGTQGLYNDDYFSADNCCVYRRCILLVTSPAGCRYWGPLSTEISHMDRCILMRAGRTPSSFTGDDGAPQDFTVGVLASTRSLPVTNTPWFKVTNSLMCIMQVVDNKITYTNCQLVNPRIGAVANRPEDIFMGRDFTRGGVAANFIADKFGYDLPNENGSVTDFVDDIWANFEPKPAYAALDIPDPTLLSWTAP